MHPEFRRAVAGTDLWHDLVRYGASADQVAEVIAPPGRTGLPALIVIHGGFWRAAYDRGHAAPQCVALARAGYVVAALEYRRVGNGGGWPITLTDVADGLDALPDLLGPLIDPARVALMGHSAGGHLALWAAGRHNLPPGDAGRRVTPAPLAGVISLGGVADLGWAVAADLGDGAAEAFIGLPPERDPDGRYARADPARLLPTGIRTICVHGGLDEHVPVDCAAAYVAAALEAGDQAELRILDWEEHFALVTPGSAAWPAVLRAVADLLG